MSAATIRKHANAVVDHCYPWPTAIIERAKKQIYRVPMVRNGKSVLTPDGRQVMEARSGPEDLFNGTMDFVVVKPGMPLHCIQYTSKGGLHARMIKMESRFLRVFERSASLEWLQSHYRVEAWGWINGTGFELWAFEWENWCFDKLGVMRSPATAVWTKHGWGLNLEWQTEPGAAPQAAPVPLERGQRVRRGGRRKLPA